MKQKHCPQAIQNEAGLFYECGHSFTETHPRTRCLPSILLFSKKQLHILFALEAPSAAFEYELLRA